MLNTSSLHGAAYQIIECVWAKQNTTNGDFAFRIVIQNICDNLYNRTLVMDLFYRFNA